MDRKILKIGYVVLLTAVIVYVIMISVQNIRMGLHSTGEKVSMALYAFLVLYAVRRIWQILKELLQK